MQAKNLKQKAFTILELVMVIAIIGVLSTIVLTNVTRYINKAKDASIQADMGTIKKNAELWLLSNGTIQGFEGSNGYAIPKRAIERNGGRLTTELYNPYHGNAYCVSSTMVSDPDKQWCIDGSGFSGGGRYCDDMENICNIAGPPI